jgi:hypothetical protein
LGLPWRIVDGLIYVAIIALWAVFLVGQLLRHHDNVAESRSADRFSTAMRILARRTAPAPDRRHIVKPPMPDGRAPTTEHLTFVKGRRSPTASRARMLARRRRILASLLLLVIVTATIGAFDWLPAWPTAVPVLLFISYVGYLRRHVRLARQIRQREAAAARSAVARRSRAEHLERLRVTREGSDTDHPAGQMLAGRVVDSAAPQDDSGSRGWDPRPWPLPTYVTAPAAPGAATRVIDLTSPGAWSKGLASERTNVRGEDPPEEGFDGIRSERNVVND